MSFMHTDETTYPLYEPFGNTDRTYPLHLEDNEIASPKRPIEADPGQYPRFRLTPYGNTAA